MSKEKRIVSMAISVDINTSASLEDVKKALQRGIYRGLDTEPYNIAAPADVEILYCDWHPFRKMIDEL
jgi:hypothetical protein